MDKRYFLIIFIAAICLTNLFFIAQSSEVIGGASVDFNKYTFSLPKDFELYSTYPDYILTYNSNFGYLSFASYDGEAINSYHYKLNDTQNSSDRSLLSNGTINVGNITVYSVYYKVNNSKGVDNQASFYFNKYDDCFKVDMIKFDSDNRNKTVDIISSVVESVRPNLKR